MMITQKYLLRRLLDVILIGMGVVPAAGGIWLATLGGSFYYICIEASLVAAGLLVFPRASAGAVPLRERGWHAGSATSVASHDIRGKPPGPRSPPGETTYEVTPLKIGDKVYLCTT